MRINPENIELSESARHYVQAIPFKLVWSTEDPDLLFPALIHVNCVFWTESKKKILGPHLASTRHYVWVIAKHRNAFLIEESGRVVAVCPAPDFDPDHRYRLDHVYGIMIMERLDDAQFLLGG